MKNPLLALFGYTQTPNPDVIGMFKLPAEEIDADKLRAHHKKLRRARAYIRMRKLAIQPLYHTKE